MVDYFNGVDVIPVVGFIPITGLGNFGTPTFVLLANPNYTFVNVGANITASADGRVWMQGHFMLHQVRSYIQNARSSFKSPGALEVNYAGPWHILLGMLRVLNGRFHP